MSGALVFLSGVLVLWLPLKGTPGFCVPSRTLYPHGAGSNWEGGYRGIFLSKETIRILILMQYLLFQMGMDKMKCNKKIVSWT